MMRIMVIQPKQVGNYKFQKQHLVRSYKKVENQANALKD